MSILEAKVWDVIGLRREGDRVGRGNCISKSPGGSDETGEQEKDVTATAARSTASPTTRPGSSNKTNKNKSNVKSKKKSGTMNDIYDPNTKA
ncbi:hypothetical protein BGZ65_012832, partial [Modicella reniformis]